MAGRGGEAWCTDDVPARERFDYYQYWLTRMSVPLELRIRDVAGFSAKTTSSSLGTIDVKNVWQSMRGESVHYRTVRQIRRSDPEAHRLMVVLAGRNRMSQAGWDVALAPGDMALYDTSRPWEVWRDRGSHQFVTVTLARDALPIAPDRVRDLCGARISGQVGIGALVSTFVSRLASEVDSYSGAAATGLSHALLDLLGYWSPICSICPRRPLKRATIAGWRPCGRSPTSNSTWPTPRCHRPRWPPPSTCPCGHCRRSSRSRA